MGLTKEQVQLQLPSPLVHVAQGHSNGFLPRARGEVYNSGKLHGGAIMTNLLRKLWLQEDAQDIAEYAVMLAVILVLVVGTIRLIGGSANNVFSATASSIGQ
jgi:Flp pilus assembly pilin Flp